MGSKIAILIIGDSQVDKTTLQRIIGEALHNHGIDAKLGTKAEREHTLAASHSSDLTLKNTTTVVMDQIDSPVIDEMDGRADQIPGVVMGYHGYEHSAGIKIVPTIKTGF